MATLEEQDTQQDTQQQQQQPAPTSSSGLDPKLGALLSYLLGIIGGIIFIIIEKDNKYVRFHAAQSIVFNIAATVVWIALAIAGVILGAVLSQVPGLGIISSLIGLLIPLIGLGIFIVWVVLLIKAWTGYDTGETFKLPVVGGIAEKIAG